MAEHSLDDIVHSIQSAVLAATDIAERHELDSIMKQEFWDNGKLVDTDVPVPMQSLTTGQSLTVDRLEVEMSVEISGLEEGKTKGKLMIRPGGNSSWFNKQSNTAKLKLVFKGSAPPEGYARIDDQLVKLLP